MHGSAKFSTCPVCFKQFRVQCDLDDPRSISSAVTSAAAQARECDHDTGGAL